MNTSILGESNRDRFLRMGCRVICVAALCAATSSESVRAAAPPLRFTPAALDRSVEACEDFYQYACGGWLAANPLPPGESWWGALHAIDQRNEAILLEIIRKAQTGGTRRTSAEQKLGDYFSACMDVSAIENDGLKPILPELQRITAMTDKQQIAAQLARLHGILYLVVEGEVFPTIAGPGSRQAVFGFASVGDPQVPERVIGMIDQGGLGLPDRDYYLTDDAASRALREQYAAHITKLLSLTGEPVPESDARRILAMETALATAWMTPQSRIDRNGIHHPMSLDELQRLMPSFSWRDYLAATGAPPSSVYGPTNPDFLRAVERLLTEASLPDWQRYLQWKLLSAVAPMLDTRFVTEHFSFFRKTLFGVDTPRPRETSCLRALDRDLPDALGPAFAAVAFNQEDKQRSLEISKQIQAEMRRTLMSTSWITEPTRRVALAKMDVLQVRLGHPDVWRDYSALAISRDSWAANAMAASIWEFRHQLAKIGRPPDASEWLVSSAKVNAYNNPRQNTLFISAAMLAPPIFDRDADDAMNYGGMGALIGHELTHSFDGYGRRYDQRGVLIDWWTAKDDANFNERARCLADQYSQYEVLDGVRLDGEQTLAENISDAAGLRLAYAAYRRSRAKPEPKREGFTPEQRFFLSYATGSCEKATDAFLRDVASGDTHSSGKYRVNGVVSNLPEFQEAFGCRKGQAMVREQMCRVW